MPPKARKNQGAPQQQQHQSAAAVTTSDQQLAIAPEKFLVSCVVNGVNNVRVMVDPFQEANTAWDRLKEYSSPRPRASRTRLTGSNLPSGGSSPQQQQAEQRPTSRLDFDPSRYLRIAAVSPLDPAHDAIAEMATRFNGRYEMHCILSAPTMFFDMDDAQQQEEIVPRRPSNVKLVPKHELLEEAAPYHCALKKKYAALLRMVFDHDPRGEHPPSGARQRRRSTSTSSVDVSAATATTAAAAISSAPNSASSSLSSSFTASSAASPATVVAAASGEASGGGGAGGSSGGGASTTSNDSTCPASPWPSARRRHHDDSNSGGSGNVQIPFSQPPFWSSQSFAVSSSQRRNSRTTSSASSSSAAAPSTAPDDAFTTLVAHDDDEHDDGDGEFEIIHRLGPVHFDTPLESAFFVATPPKAMSLIICEVADEELEPADILLARTVRDILEADEYRGSYPSCQIQNFVRTLVPCYDEVVGSVADAIKASEAAAAAANTTTTASDDAKNKQKQQQHPQQPIVGIYDCWNDFVDAHTGIEWGSFRYTPDMVESVTGVKRDKNNAGGGGGLLASEPRLVAWAFIDKFIEADAAREQLRRSCEEDVREYIKSHVAKRPHTQFEVAKLLSESRAFLSTLSPQVPKLLDMLEQDPRYVVLRDRLHPIMVERKT